MDVRVDRDHDPGHPEPLLYHAVKSRTKRHVSPIHSLESDGL